MSPFSITTGPIQCQRITSFFPLSFSASYNSSCNISIHRRKLTRKVHSHGNSVSSFPYQFSSQRNLCSEKQRGLFLIAFDSKKSESKEGEDNHAVDAAMKLYSAFKNKNTRDLSADEHQRVNDFLSFFETFQGRTQVLEFFSYLTSIFGNNVQIVLKPTPHDGINFGLEWRFDWDKIHVPLGKGFSLQIKHSYHGKAVIRNIEIFMEPLLYLKPFGLKMKVGLREFIDKIGSFMVSETAKKAKRILYVVIAMLSLAAAIFFMKLAT